MGTKTSKVDFVCRYFFDMQNTGPEHIAVVSETGSAAFFLPDGMKVVHPVVCKNPFLLTFAFFVLCKRQNGLGRDVVPTVILAYISLDHKVLFGFECSKVV